MAEGAPRVLVVDDDPDTREMLAAVLTGEGYRVMTAADGAMGVAMALYTRPDLVLTDLQMPRLDGAAVCRQLMAESRTRGVPVLVITALPAADAGARLACCPPDGVIRKPYDLAAVLRAVAEALRRGGRDAPPA
jgi:DNA-binding response OmpR family regulator